MFSNATGGADALISVMQARARQLRFRLALPLIIAPAFHQLTGWEIATAWVATYLALQCLESSILPIHRIADRLLSPVWRRVVLGLVVLNGAVFGAFGIAQANLGGATGVACGALLLCGAAMNAVLISAGSRQVFFAAMAPQVAYFVMLPFVADGGNGAPFDVFALGLAAALNVAAAALAWRLSARILLAEQSARNAAEKATAAKSAFVAMISHELRTPISAILAGAAEIERAGSDEMKSNGALITSSARMMRELLNDLLDLSKMEAGRMSVESIPFELSQLLRDTVAFWSVEAGKKGVAMVVEQDDNLISWVSGDPTRLRQILNNLLSNAIKFTDAGRIVMAVSQVDEPGQSSIRFAVSDSGRGMTGAQQSRLFTPFDQLDDATARTHGGTGLGLAISRQLARLMAGDLTATSELGQGSTFVLIVPLPATEAGKCADPKVALPSSAGLRVLIADDHEVNRRAFALILGPLCERVVTVSNGLEALAALELSAFDLVLMDMNMPIMGGLEAVGALRSGKGPNAATPVVALTASVSDADRAACAAAGMDGFVGKPVEASELFTILDQVLNTSSRHAAVAASSVS